MKNSKSKLAIIVLMATSLGCQTIDNFEIETVSAKNEGFDDLQIISVRANRVVQKCVFLNAAAENSWRHHYYLYVLNNQNEVIEIVDSMNLDKESCVLQAQKVEKILRANSAVRLCARNDLKKLQTDKIQSGVVGFGALGEHKLVYETLILDSICGSRGCFSKNSTWVNTCPGFQKN